ncbi:MAG: hypothetical protein A3F11_10160 [Gammaproteobacteria bacterium RIFCSPHIGHO2_12_FULL_37_14]|nr:MAG: hypothetical protein A3F11_10160 [Gammaproteobacteria bacterium RIFCSPHIGHO2_12_FULL_37_14]
MLDQIKISDWLNVAAIILSPIFALQVGKILDSLSNKKRRKEEIFNTLMETRAQTLSYEHVRALNKIDIAFYKDKSVRESWASYRDHLSSYPKEGDDTDKKIWTDKIPQKLADLLARMAKLLKYDFDETLLIKGAYIPSAHDLIEKEQSVLRQALVETFALKHPLNVRLVSGDDKAKQTKG